MARTDFRAALRLRGVAATVVDCEMPGPGCLYRGQIYPFATGGIMCEVSVIR